MLRGPATTRRRRTLQFGKGFLKRSSKKRMRAKTTKSGNLSREYESCSGAPRPKVDILFQSIWSTRPSRQIPKFAEQRSWCSNRRSESSAVPAGKLLLFLCRRCMEKRKIRYLSFTGGGAPWREATCAAQFGGKLILSDTQEKRVLKRIHISGGTAKRSPKNKGGNSPVLM